MCRSIQIDLLSGAARDGIPALTNPELVSPDANSLGFLSPTDRVIGLEINGEFVAVPHNILWWHEIANFDEFGLAVTYCPLTGSSMVFDRAGANGAEFGTSGFLFNNNLVMFDRTAVEGEDSLWPQMLAGAFCGPSEGKRLKLFPHVEMEWEDWLALHPDTRVVSSETGFPRDYTLYPYGVYERLDNDATLADIKIMDDRRPIKERVLGIPFNDGGGIAFPFGALRDASVGGLTVVHTVLGDPDAAEGGQGGGEPVMVFWDAGAASAVAFVPTDATQTFEVRNGAFVDVETGSEWDIEGKAISGPLEGDRLQVMPEAYVSFWFAFAQFFATPVLWLP